MFIETRRCRGHCCVDFCVNPDMDPGTWRRKFIARERSEQPAQFVYLGWAPPWKDCTGHRYTCTWLTKSGDCARYEERPAMCHEYPHEGITRPNGSCERDDCQRLGYYAAGCRYQGKL